MECIKSFNLFLNGNFNFPPANGFESWTIGGQNFWCFDSTNVPTTFFVEGYKNINIYSVELGGDVTTDNLPAGFQCLVENYSVTLQIIGQNSAIAGKFSTPNGFALSTQAINPVFKLSKYLPKINFASPIQSSTEIIMSGLKADGIANESLASSQINFALSLTIFYKYEGEDFALL
jgi:hypothetical protein